MKSSKSYSTIVALAFTLIAFVGFRQFYLHGTIVTQKIKFVIYTHGFVATAWILVFLAQSILIATNRRREHRILGWVAVGLAVALIVTGLWVAVESARARPNDQLFGLTMKQFLVIPVTDIICFGIFVSLGVLYRSKVDVHRPMFQLATLRLLGAATSRMTTITMFYYGTLWSKVFGHFLPMLIIGALFIILRWITVRAIDYWYVIGYLAILVTCPMIYVFAGSRLWSSMARVLFGIN